MEFDKFYEIGLTEEMIAAIDEIYDDMFIVDVINNIEQVKQNIELLNKYGFRNFINEIVVRYLPIFMNDSETVKKSIEKLINSIGNNYIEEISEDMTLLEEII